MAISSNADVASVVLRKYLECEALESRSEKTIEFLDSLVKKDLRMNMHNKVVISGMKNLFVFNQAVLRRNGDSKSKVAVEHVLLTIAYQKEQTVFLLT